MRQLFLSYLFAGLGVCGAWAQQTDDILSLKWRAAVAAGLDTTEAYRLSVAGYRQERAMEVLYREVAGNGHAPQTYNRLASAGSNRRLLFSQIFRRVPQHAPADYIRQSEAQMDSIERALQAGLPFTQAVALFSDSKDSLWADGLQVTAEFEGAVFGLAVGQRSQPFWTPQGMYIVKVLDERVVTMEESLRAHQERTRSMNNPSLLGQAAVEDLKAECRFEQSREAVGELFQRGSTRKTLFTIDGRPVTGEQFARFASVYPAGIRKQYDRFVLKELLAHKSRQVADGHAAVESLTQAFARQWLADEITRQVIEPSANDEQGLHRFFERNKKRYEWDVPKFKGVIIHAASKKAAKRVRKILKKIDEPDRADAARLILGDDLKAKVKVVELFCAKGEDPQVDALFFGEGKAAPLPGYPYAMALGSKKTAPDSYLEIREQVLRDYLRQLEQDWLAELRRGNFPGRVTTGR